MVRSFDEYRDAVAKALAPYGLRETEEQSRKSYQDYLSSIDVVGDGDLIAERNHDGEVRIFLTSPRQRSAEEAYPR
jgi:hypothetical protein